MIGKIELFCTDIIDNSDRPDLLFLEANPGRLAAYPPPILSPPLYTNNVITDLDNRSVKLLMINIDNLR